MILSSSRGNAAAPDGAFAAAGAALCAAVVSALVYRAVLGSYFWNDDFAWLFLLHEKGLVEFLFTPMGGHSLVARNAVIALLDATVGLDPRPWFVTVLLTHALNAALLARLVWLSTGSALLAAIGALAWGTCPAAAGTLAWYAVYAQVAATALLLVAFNRVGRLARDGIVPSARDLTLVTALLVLSSLFFGTAVGVALVWPVAVGMLIPGSVRGPRRLGAVLAVTAVVLGVYLALQAVGVWAFYANDQASRVFGWIGERWWSAVVSMGQLLRVGTTSLLLGPWWAPAERSDVASWGVLAIALAGWAVAAWRASPRLRAVLASSLLVAFAIYGLIAISRGASAGPMFQRTSAQIGATMRYHYAPQVFLVVATCAALSVLAPRRRELVASAWGLLLFCGQLRYGVQVDLREASRAEVTQALAFMRSEIAATPEGSTAYLKNTPLATMGWLPNTKENPPGLAALFVIAYPSDVVDGRVVRFIEPREPLRARAMLREGRTATLLVPAP